ncbi:nickel/cobalt efflux transporter, partial [Leclercia adecarboxylata]
MTDFATLLQQGNAWLFVPSAILLGALHGLEPGHSKTMMAAFIVAIRGTMTQAILLGLSATLSHTAVVWLVALAGLYFGRNWQAEATEPYFQVASAVLIIAVAVWMLWRTWRDQHEHDHHHDHGHDEPQR